MNFKFPLLRLLLRSRNADELGRKLVRACWRLHVHSDQTVENNLSCVCVD